MSELTILSHNAYWFQGVPFEGTSPGAPDEAVLSGLIELYRQIGPDVLCLQEVQSADAFRAMAAGMTLEGRYLPGGSLPQYGVAALWRNGRPLTRGAPQVVPQRMWQLLEIPDGERCLVVCNVHLPSSRQLGRDGAARQRLAELADILAADPQPAVLAGDFNEAPGGDVGALLTERGYLDAAVLSGKEGRPTTLGGGRSDAIWLREDVRRRLVEYGVCGMEQAAVRQPGKTHLSDHLPLWVRLSL